MKRFLPVAAAVPAAVALYALSLYNYLLFHTLAEGFAILVAGTIFIIAWNCRRYFENHYFLFIGIAYLFIGILDLVHTFVYKGMNLMPGYDANAPTQLWIAARYVESLTLLVAPLMTRRRIRVGLIFGGYSLLVLFLLLSILHWRVFPDCFVENAGGLTPFKKVSEYVISLILLAAGALVVRVRQQFDAKVLRWMLLSILFTVFSELAFTTYASVYGFSNMLGHYLKIISFYLIYKALIETGLAKPYDLLFRDLDRQREWLRVTLGSIGDAVIATDLNSRVTYMNHVASSLTGWQPQEALGRIAGDVLRTINEHTREPAPDIIACVLKDGCVLEMANPTALISRDGRVIPIEDSAAPIKDSIGHIIGTVVVFHDVTEQRAVEARLRQRELLYRELVQNANSAIIRWKSDGTISFFNEYAQKFFGYQSEEVLGKHVGIIVPAIESDDADLKDPAKDIVHHPDRYLQNIHENVCRDGRRVWMNWTNKPIRDENGNVVEVLSVGSDITQIKAAEEALQNVNKELELKVLKRTEELANNYESLRLANAQLKVRADQLRRLASELTMTEQRERKRLSKILHDGLQQHMAAAKLRIGYFVNKLSDPHHRQEACDIETILAESIQMSRSLSVELSPPVLREAGLAGALEWLERWMRDTHNFNVDLSVEGRPDLPEDVTILVFESVRELLFNAVKHARISWARVSLQPDGNSGARVVVSDEGVGFDSSRLNSIQSATRGLGLFSIQERLDSIGGTFEISSAPGNGCRFTLVAPGQRIGDEK